MSKPMVLNFKKAVDLDKAIKSAIAGAKNQREFIQQVAIGIVSFASGRGNGNVTRAKTLVDGLGEGVRCDSLVQWFSLTGVVFDDEGNVSLDRDRLNTENFNKAKGLNWWEAKKAPSPYKAIGFQESLIRTLKSMYKSYVDGIKAAAEVEGVDTMCEISAEEIAAYEAFVQKQVGAGNMPKRPDALKVKSMGTAKNSAAA